MLDKIMYTLANILMVVEAVALVFLISAWIKAKKGDSEDGNET